jgi:hypothetical protein
VTDEQYAAWLEEHGDEPATSETMRFIDAWHALKRAERDLRA